MRAFHAEPDAIKRESRLPTACPEAALCREASAGRCARDVRTDEGPRISRSAAPNQRRSSGTPAAGDTKEAREEIPDRQSGRVGLLGADVSALGIDFTAGLPRLRLTPFGRLREALMRHNARLKANSSDICC